MQHAPPDLPEIKRNLWRLPFALAFGLALGLFVNGYWLASVFPATSRLLLVLTLAVIALGCVLGWLLFAWVFQRLALLPIAGRLAAAGLALLTGAFLLFGGTAAWQAPSQYLGFLLPTHQFRLVASAAQARGDLELTWFTTSVGDVSYDAMQIKGWRRSGDKLVLQDPDSNALEWQGRTGADIQMRFRASGPAPIVTIIWDGHSEELAAGPGQFTYTRHLGAPWYASRALVWALGLLVFSILCLALYLYFWERRAILLPAIRSSMRRGAGGWSRIDTLVLLAGIVVAAALRLPELGRLAPAVDEYYHLIAARQLVEGAAMSSIYQRSLWMVTWPVSLAFRTFGYQLWAARAVGAIMNILAVWPLYLLGRRINRPVAALAVLLFATSPWLVTFARVTREYAYYPFFFCWIMLGMVAFIERIPPGSVLVRDWRSVFTPKMAAIAAALLLPPVFALAIDTLSTFRVILLAYIVFAAFVLARFSWRGRRGMSILAALAVALLVTAYAWYARDTVRILPAPRYNPVPVEYFLPDPPQQWYYARATLVVALLLVLAAVGSFLSRRENILPVFLLTVFLTNLAFFSFLSKTFFHTRHLSATQLWYVILMALGAYFAWVLWRALRPQVRRLVNVLVAVALVLSLVNVRQLLAPITSTDPDNPISEDYLHDMAGVHAFMLAHARPDEVLVSTVYGLYSAWREEPKFAASFRITTETPPDVVLGLIEGHASGWIVIDQIRLGMSTLGPHAFAGNPDVEYIGLFGDQNVWHWQHAPAGIGNIQFAGKAPWIFRW